MAMLRKLEGRQGDVGFVRCLIPKGAKRVPFRPFALGEVTGHSHRVCVEDQAGVELFETTDENGVRTWLRVTSDGAVSIQHEDHDPRGTTSVLPKGWEGEVVIAREYTPESIRSVVD